MAVEERKDTEALRNEIAQLQSDFSAISKTVQNIAARTGTDAYQKTRDYAKRAGDSIEAQVEERPFTSLLVSFAIGLIVGLLFQRRS